MIEMRVRYKNRIDCGEVGDAQPGAAQAFQHEEPSREIRINDNVPAADLHKEAGMTNECDAEFSVGDETGLVGFAGEPSYSGTAHQTPELGSALAKGRIAKCLLDHPCRGRFALFILALVIVFNG